MGCSTGETSAVGCNAVQCNAVQCMFTTQSWCDRETRPKAVGAVNMETASQIVQSTVHLQYSLKYNADKYGIVLVVQSSSGQYSEVQYCSVCYNIT